MSESLEQPEAIPDRYESGTLNVPGIAGLAAGIEYIMNTGRENIHKKERALSEMLMLGLTEINGITVYAPEIGMDRGSVVSATMDGIEPQELALLLDSEFDIAVRSGLHCAA